MVTGGLERVEYLPSYVVLLKCSLILVSVVAYELYFEHTSNLIFAIYITEAGGSYSWCEVK